MALVGRVATRVYGVGYFKAIKNLKNKIKSVMNSNIDATRVLTRPTYASRLIQKLFIFLPKRQKPLRFLRISFHSFRFFI